jgi:hypothetical protein
MLWPDCSCCSPLPLPVPVLCCSQLSPLCCSFFLVNMSSSTLVRDRREAEQNPSTNSKSGGRKKSQPHRNPAAATSTNSAAEDQGNNTNVQRSISAAATRTVSQAELDEETKSNNSTDDNTAEPRNYSQLKPQKSPDKIAKPKAEKIKKPANKLAAKNKSKLQPKPGSVLKGLLASADLSDFDRITAAAFPEEAKKEAEEKQRIATRMNDSQDARELTLQQWLDLEEEGESDEVSPDNEIDNKDTNSQSNVRLSKRAKHSTSYKPSSAVEELISNPSYSKNFRLFGNVMKGLWSS